MTLDYVDQLTVHLHRKLDFIFQKIGYYSPENWTISSRKLNKMVQKLDSLKQSLSQVDIWRQEKPNDALMFQGNFSKISNLIHPFWNPYLELTKISGRGGF